MDAISAVKVVLSFIVLLAASRSDWKTRTASDWYWVILGLVGLGFLAFQIYSDDADPLYYLFLIPVAVVFFDVFWDRKGIFENGINPLPLLLYAASAAALILLAATFWQEVYFWQLISILFMFLLIIIFYQLNLIKGGADAKALLCLSIVFPSYPDLSPYVLIGVPIDIAQYLFPFSLLVLFNAALLSLAVPVMLFFYNLAKGDRKVPVMFFGYRIPVDEARKKFVWPLEYVEEGRRVFRILPRSLDSYDKEYDELKALGAEEIWVTPKIPFLIPITVSLLFSALVGNIIFFFAR